MNGIPTLVVLDAAGKLITADGREAVDDDPLGAKFPWVPPSLQESLGDAFVNAKGETVTFESLVKSGNHVALYFSAHWCGPCRGFTPNLVKTYEAIRAAKAADPARAGLDIIFVSSDRDEASFKCVRGGRIKEWILREGLLSP